MERLQPVLVPRRTMNDCSCRSSSSARRPALAAMQCWRARNGKSSKQHFVILYFYNCSPFSTPPPYSLLRSRRSYTKKNYQLYCSCYCIVQVAAVVLVLLVPHSTSKYYTTVVVLVQYVRTPVLVVLQYILYYIQYYYTTAAVL